MSDRVLTEGEYRYYYDVWIAAQVGVETYDIQFICKKKGGPDECDVEMESNPFYRIGFNGRGACSECERRCRYGKAVIQ